METDSTLPADRDDTELTTDLKERIEQLGTVDAPEAADIASELAATLSGLLDGVETV